MNRLDEAIKQLQTEENIDAICLGNAEIGDNGVGKLAQALLSGEVSAVTTIYLPGNKITDTGIKLLVPALKKCKALKCLNLDGNSIEHYALKQLHQVLLENNHTVTELKVTSQNGAGKGIEFRTMLEKINELLKRNREETESKKMQHSEEIEQEQELEQPEEANAMQDESLLAAASNIDNSLKVMPLGEDCFYSSDVIGN